jgi:hypothetical protein
MWKSVRWASWNIVASTKDIQELHIEITGSETVLCYGAFVVPSSLPFLCCDGAIDMSSIQCADSALEKGEELGIISNLG